MKRVYVLYYGCKKRVREGCKSRVTGGRKGGNL
jgi:hypothetical protein